MTGPRNQEIYQEGPDDDGIAAIWELWQDRGQRAEARTRALEYVQKHRDMADSFADLSQEDFVHYVEQARAEGDGWAMVRAEVWAMSQPPVYITGTGRIGP